MKTFILTLTNPLCGSPTCLTHNPATAILIATGVLECHECELEEVDEDGNVIPEQPQVFN